MVAPIGINTNTYSQANATRNMQQVGGQSQVTRKNDVAPQSETHNTAAADNVQLSEGVSFAQDAQENATHVGAAQNQFEEEIGDTFESAEEPEVGAAQSGAAGTAEEAAAPKEPQTDEYGFILMDDQGNTIGGSVPTDDGGAGTPPPVDGDNGGAAGEVPRLVLQRCGRHHLRLRPRGRDLLHRRQRRSAVDAGDPREVCQRRGRLLSGFLRHGR